MPGAPTHHQIEHLEDFTKHEWCRVLLSDPSITKITKRSMPNPEVSNSLFVQTLFTEDAVRAFLSMFRPGRVREKSIADAEVAGDALIWATQNDGDEGISGQEPRAQDNQADLDEPESLILVSVGSGVDGGKHRLHGGLIATLLDQVMGLLINYLHGNTSATAELTVKYKRVVTTPAVLLCRGRIVREAGRWTEVMGWIEDGSGGVYAEGSGAFVKSKVNNGVQAKI
ncbi:hypothetical protein K469DRAFT_706447 [Zopfia rhizophila CBS 207.26]|uniref:Thioesterase domain-containing protein n=1 Tax=Zopfia rhizophila CBS 207.26 TaxID=1314779 RepID=A0A6A6E3K5_9PEZI|nr:hypothetical protein K469DRAFT_706447 [Zopfia rhizophila CBS 207.26]